MRDDDGVTYPEQQERAVLLGTKPLRGLSDGAADCKPGTVPFQRLELKRQKCMRVRGASPGQIVEVLRKELKDVAQEHAGVMLLNTRNEVISIVQVGIGGLNSAAVDARVVFGAALVAGAAAVILYHNHPSGDSQPSIQDVALTKMLSKFGKELGVQVLDHIIVTPTSYRSFRADGLMQD